MKALTVTGAAESRWTETRIGRVHALEMRGSGESPLTAVLLHGFSSAGSHLVPLAHGLRRRFSRIVLPDAPGHGLSDQPPGHASAHRISLAHFEALDALVKGPMVLFGNSMGGYGAIRYALSRPERVKALILASPGGAWMSELELRHFVERFRVDSHQKALNFVDRVMETRSWLRHVLAAGIRRRFSRPELQHLLQNLKNHELLDPDDLKALVMPVLCVWGGRDRVLPQTHVEFFRRHLPPSARFEVVAGLGHSPYLEQPLAMARRMLAFTEEALPGRTSSGAPAAKPRAVKPSRVRAVTNRAVQLTLGRRRSG